MITQPQADSRKGPSYDQLEAFLAAAEVERIGTFRPSGRTAGLIIRARGDWLGEDIERGFSLEELYEILFALIDLAQTRGGGLRASIRRHYLWLGGPRWAPKLTPVCGGSDPVAEKRTAREIAELFVWLATGLDVQVLRSGLDERRFCDWCEVADKHLARLMVLWLKPNSKPTPVFRLGREVELAMLQSGVLRRG